MPSITGIELGPDSCVLVRARPHAGGAEISALHVFERSEWPSHDTALIAALRRVRRAKGFSRRARVVAWGLTEPVRKDDAIAQSIVKPFVSAGFRVEAILTAPEALAEIARTRPRGRGVAAVWLALNMHGAAIAIVRDGELLFGRTFDWNYKSGVVGTRAELLQRYSLVAHLAPEVHRGITLVKRAHGATVEAAVTCGDLPELRSLTMPLIEELDLEVETLDSTEGLCATVKARLERLVESAPAVRLATAAATAAGGEPRRQTTRPWLRVAAAIVILATLAWGGYAYWNDAPARPVAERVADAPAATLTAGTAAAAAASVSALLAPPPVETPDVQASAPPTAVTTPPPPVVTPPAVPATKTEIAPQNPAISGTPRSGESAPTSPLPASPTPPASSNPSSGDGAPKSQSGTNATAPAASKPQAPKPQEPKPPEPKAQERQAGPPAKAQGPEQRPAGPVTEPVNEPATQAPPPIARARQTPPAMEPAPVRTAPPRRTPVPLKEPIPAVDSILVSNERRVAIVGGQIVSVGDRVGSRLVAGIERDVVVLQEPSGYRIFVRLRRRPGT